MEEESEMTQTDSADIVQTTDEHRHTPRKKDFPLWIIVHFNSTIIQLTRGLWATWGDICIHGGAYVDA